MTSEKDLRRSLQNLTQKRDLKLLELRKLRREQTECGQALSRAQTQRSSDIAVRQEAFDAAKKAKHAKVQEIDQIEQQIQNARGALLRHLEEGEGRPPVAVHEHAVIQYLALAKGVDIDAVRHEILTEINRRPETVHNFSTSTFNSPNGLRYVVRDGVVISVLEPDL